MVLAGVAVELGGALAPDEVLWVLGPGGLSSGAKTFNFGRCVGELGGALAPDEVLWVLWPGDFRWGLKLCNFGW